MIENSSMIEIKKCMILYHLVPLIHWGTSKYKPKRVVNSISWDFLNGEIQTVLNWEGQEAKSFAVDLIFCMDTCVKNNIGLHITQTFMKKPAASDIRK